MTNMIYAKVLQLIRASAQLIEKALQSFKLVVQVGEIFCCVIEDQEKNPVKGMIEINLVALHQLNIRCARAKTRYLYYQSMCHLVLHFGTH